jgi:hypothetical protein
MEAHENTNEKHNSFGHAILHAPHHPKAYYYSSLRLGRFLFETILSRPSEGTFREVATHPKGAARGTGMGNV